MFFVRYKKFSRCPMANQYILSSTNRMTFFALLFLTNNSISHEPIDRFAESKDKEVRHKLTNFDRVFSWNKNLNYFVCKLGLAKIGI